MKKISLWGSFAILIIALVMIVGCKDSIPNSVTFQLGEISQPFSSKYVFKSDNTFVLYASDGTSWGNMSEGTVTYSSSEIVLTSGSSSNNFYTNSECNSGVNSYEKLTSVSSIYLPEYDEEGAIKNTTTFNKK